MLPQLCPHRHVFGGLELHYTDGMLPPPTNKINSNNNLLIHKYDKRI